MRASRPLPARADYTTLDVLTLVVAAPDDPVHPYDLAITLSQWLPRAQFTTVPRKMLDAREHQHAVQQAVSANIHQSMQAD